MSQQPKLIALIWAAQVGHRGCPKQPYVAGQEATNSSLMWPAGCQKQPQKQPHVDTKTAPKISSSYPFVELKKSSGGLLI